MKNENDPELIKERVLTIIHDDAFGNDKIFEDVS